MKPTGILWTLVILTKVYSLPNGSLNPGSRAEVANKTFVVEDYFNAECKACPELGCINKAIYNAKSTVNGTCWTGGTAINNSSAWVKTDKDCYITEWAFTSQNVSEDLPNCGFVQSDFPEVEAKTRYLSQCIVQPVAFADTVIYYKNNTDLTVTCKTNATQIVGNPIWYRTKTSYCFVPAAELWPSDGLNSLPDCGPIPDLEARMFDPDGPHAPAVNDGLGRRATQGVQGVNVVNRNAISAALPSKSSNELSKRWLYRNTIEDDYVPCYKSPCLNGTVSQVYTYMKTVVLQCGFDWRPRVVLTTDWCWISDQNLTTPLEDSQWFKQIRICDMYNYTQEWDGRPLWVNTAEIYAPPGGSPRIC